MVPVEQTRIQCTMVPEVLVKQVPIIATRIVPETVTHMMCKTKCTMVPEEKVVKVPVVHTAWCVRNGRAPGPPQVQDRDGKDGVCRVPEIICRQVPMDVVVQIPRSYLHIRDVHRDVQSLSPRADLRPGHRPVQPDSAVLILPRMNGKSSRHSNYLLLLSLTWT